MKQREISSSSWFAGMIKDGDRKPINRAMRSSVGENGRVESHAQEVRQQPRRSLRGFRGSLPCQGSVKVYQERPLPEPVELLEVNVEKRVGRFSGT
jgi:hypothetical protein